MHGRLPRTNWTLAGLYNRRAESGNPKSGACCAGTKRSCRNLLCDFVRNAARPCWPGQNSAWSAAARSTSRPPAPDEAGGERARRPQHDYDGVRVGVRHDHAGGSGGGGVDHDEDARSGARANRQRPPVAIAPGAEAPRRVLERPGRSRMSRRIRRPVEVRTAVCRRDIPRSSCRPRRAPLSIRSNATRSRNPRTSRRGTSSARSRCARRCSIKPTTARPRTRTATC